jgi:hypothetical protein
MIDLNVSDTFTDARGFTYSGMSQPWKDLCEALPCSMRVQFPNYATMANEFTLDGERVVIQAWRGNCPKGFGLRQMPGGIGGEVGVYKKDPNRKIPKLLDLPLDENVWSPAMRDVIRFLISPVIRLFVGGVQEGTERWFPFRGLNAEIGMTFKNPEANDETFFSTNTGSGNNGPEPRGGYWLSRWMSFRSFNDWKARQRDQRDKVPMWAVNYTMEFNVGRHRFEWLDKDTRIRQLS